MKFAKNSALKGTNLYYDAYKKYLEYKIQFFIEKRDRIKYFSVEEVDILLRVLFQELTTLKH